MNTLKKISINAVALWIAALVLPGLQMTISGNSQIFNQPLLQENPMLTKVVMFLILGVIFGLVNALVKPIVKFFAFPLNVLTLGLFTFVVNAAMLMLTAFLSQYAPAQMHVNSFLGSAIPGAIIITIFSVIASNFLTEDS